MTTQAPAPSSFDPKTLPAWAQKNSKVVELCKRDSAYRMNVIVCGNAKAYRQMLIQQAEQA